MDEWQLKQWSGKAVGINGTYIVEPIYFYAKTNDTLSEVSSEWLADVADALKELSRQRRIVFKQTVDEWWEKEKIKRFMEAHSG